MDLDHLHKLVVAAVHEGEATNSDGTAFDDLLAYIARISITTGATENAFLRHEVKQRVDERDVARAEVARLRAVVQMMERQGRELLSRPERILLPSAAKATDWVINDIKIGNVVAPPYTDEDRRRDAERALRHDPMIARTLKGGPGNHRRIVGCACKDPGVHDTATWAAHVGVPSDVGFLKTIFALQDAAQDAIDYPGEETLAHLAEVLRRAKIAAPGPMGSGAP